MPPRIPNDFFKSWTDDMAYCLGLWWADGCLYRQKRGGCVVIFSSTDREHLQRVQRVVGAGNIYMIKHSGRTSHQLIIGRKDMLEDIAARGGTPRKTSTASWPDVPPAFLSHFARGYVDGDGSLFWHVNKGLLPIPRVAIIGTESFLTGMSPAIEAVTGIPSPTVVRHSGLLWQMSWVGVAAKCLTAWLYEDSHLHLERKRALAEEFMKWWPRVYHRSLTTAPMRDRFRSYLPG